MSLNTRVFCEPAVVGATTHPNESDQTGEAVAAAMAAQQRAQAVSTSKRSSAWAPLVYREIRFHPSRSRLGNAFKRSPGGRGKMASETNPQDDDIWRIVAAET